MLTVIEVVITGYLDCYQFSLSKKEETWLADSRW